MRAKRQAIAVSRRFPWLRIKLGLKRSPAVLTLEDVIGSLVLEGKALDDPLGQHIHKECDEHQHKSGIHQC